MRFLPNTDSVELLQTQISKSRWRFAKPGCRSWKRVIASRFDAPADCVRARARGGYSVSRRSRKIGRRPPTLIREHGSSFSEVGQTGSPVTAPRSDAPADCVRARARDADALRDGREKSVAARFAHRLCHSLAHADRAFRKSAKAGCRSRWHRPIADRSCESLAAWGRMSS